MDNPKKSDGRCIRCRRPLLNEDDSLCIGCEIDTYFERKLPSARIYEFPSGKVLAKGKKIGDEENE